MRNALLICLICLPILLQSQDWHFGGELGWGRLLKHTEEFAFESNPNNYYAEFHLNWQSSDRQAWARYHRYPIVQIVARYHNYGNPDLLGEAIGLYPTLVIPIHDGPAFPISFTGGMGVAWSSRKYDRIGLPLNNAIGSHWNNVTTLKLEVGLPFFYNWHTGLTFSMTHMSNGRTKTPNYGLNTFHLGINFREQDSPDYVSINDKAERAPWVYQPWYFEAGATLGIHEAIKPGGPKYGTYGVQGSVTHSLDPIQRLSLGVEVEYNSETADFLLGSFEVDSRKEANARATNLALFVRDEFLFGPCGFGITAGVYLIKEQPSFPIYNKLDIRYYFGTNEKGKGTYISVLLKSHLANAAYIGAGAGYRF